MEKSKYVYFFGGGKAEGSGSMKSLLGGKGAGLAEMTAIGLPVPAGFTITTKVCEEYYKSNKKYSPELKKQVEQYLLKLEKLTGKKLGDKDDPLLVSVRSGAAVLRKKRIICGLHGTHTAALFLCTVPLR